MSWATTVAAHGTKIGYTKLGTGPGLIFVQGAMAPPPITPAWRRLSQPLSRF